MHKLNLCKPRTYSRQMWAANAPIQAYQRAFEIHKSILGNAPILSTSIWDAQVHFGQRAYSSVSTSVRDAQFHFGQRAYSSVSTSVRDTQLHFGQPAYSSVSTSVWDAPFHLEQPTRLFNCIKSIDIHNSGMSGKRPYSSISHRVSHTQVRCGRPTPIFKRIT